MKRRLSIVPKAFLFFFPLHLGAELIIAIGLLNKASGFYGILSIFTGHPLSVMEWILNILSLVTLPLYIMAFQTIHTRNALRMVLFAYLYTIDTLCSVGFSVYFCVHWFTEKAKVVAASGSESSSSGSGDVTTSAAASMATNASADVYRRDSAADSNAINKSASLPQETATTITITVVFLLVRLYFNLIILAYARQLVRQQNLRPHNGSNQSTLKGRVQYIALSIAQSFWTGSTWSSTSAALSSSSSSSSVSSSRRSNLDEATTRLNSDFDDVDDHQYTKE
ncbi:hypothetical protein TRICI_001972 [Trichomonascus ciferrii]|uniref:Inositolphosphorylceramide synthase subunit Kei1 domain-containing protein n=1 Tax=Trichomonascus ciferrii TaxID=44093 RepID=A0A642V843_9ASCO|nr:hypothetical protein TRICI_001972 [Trichomonascus ciferrii]